MRVFGRAFGTTLFAFTVEGRDCGGGSGGGYPRFVEEDEEEVVAGVAFDCTIRLELELDSEVSGGADGSGIEIRFRIGPFRGSRPDCNKFLHIS